MAINSKVMLRSSFVFALLTAVFVLMAAAANAQEAGVGQTAKTEVASSTTVTTKKADVAQASVPVFKDYKGIKIGMSADEVRAKLDHLKEKGKIQDVFVFSDAESAQVYYDEQGKVMAISANYVGDNSNAPKPEAVLGEEIQAKADGSMYELKRYPSAGYWIAYSRTAGNNPLVTVTMQKMQ